MKELMKEIELVVGNELSRAAGKFGPVNNGDHESYAIILEEFEEAAEEGERFGQELSVVWKSIRENRVQKEDYLELKRRAVLASAEWVQVAAMCQKALNTIEQT